MSSWFRFSSKLLVLLLTRWIYRIYVFDETRIRATFMERSWHRRFDEKNITRRAYSIGSIIKTVGQTKINDDENKYIPLRDPETLMKWNEGDSLLSRRDDASFEIDDSDYRCLVIHTFSFEARFYHTFRVSQLVFECFILFEINMRYHFTFSEFKSWIT